jgi:hypothetical protein
MVDPRHRVEPIRRFHVAENANTDPETKFQGTKSSHSQPSGWVAIGLHQEGRADRSEPEWEGIATAWHAGADPGITRSIALSLSKVLLREP